MSRCPVAMETNVATDSVITGQQRYRQPLLLLMLVLLLTVGGAHTTTGMVNDDVSRATMERSIKHLGADTSLRYERRCGTKDIRKESALLNLRNCTVIEGNLLLAIMTLRRDNWYFPKLKEVTGYVLIYFVSSLTVMGMFPNLVVIRGQHFLYNYAFIVKDCQMEYLGLNSLRLIQRGGVRIEGNSELCHTDSIDWKRLTTHGVSSKSWAGSQLPWERWQLTGRTSKENMIYLINNRRLCPGPCPINCPRAQLGSITRELCWSHRACQSICKVKCPYDAPCHMLDTNKCCHRECLAGCYGPSAHECVTCKNVLHNGQCINKCPENLYKFSERRCVTKEECFRHRTKDPNNYAKTMPYVIVNGSCLHACPPQHERNSTGHCERCDPSCPKRCSVALIYSIRDSERVSGCASIRNLYISIRDGGQGAHVIQELKKNFEHLRVVEQSLRVVRSFSLQSLSFLSNLREIRGELKKDRSNDFISEDKVISFEVIGNERLESLWDIPAGEKLTIHRGRISINMNRQLCSDKVLKFIDQSVVLKGHNLTQAERHFITKANGDLMPCNVTKLNISVRGIRSRQASIMWPRVKDNERKLLTMLVMIKPTEKNISVSFDRASCDANSWKALDATCNYHMGSENFCSFIIHQLLPSKRYGLYVEAKTKQGGSGAISDIVYLTTKPETPSRPVGVRVEPLSAFALKVIWQAPKYPHGVITAYRIWYRRLGIRYRDYLSRNFCDRKVIQSLPHLTLSSDHKYYDDEATPERQWRLNFNSSAPCVDCKRHCLDGQELSGQDEQAAFEDKLMQHIFTKLPNAKVESTKDFPVPSMGAESLNTLSPTGEGFTNGTAYRRAWSTVSVGATPRRLAITTRMPPTIQLTSPAPISAGPTALWEGPIILNAAGLPKENGKFFHVISGLSHYSEYAVELQACQAPPPEDADYSICSARARGLHRTLPHAPADNINESDIHVDEPTRPILESGTVSVHWRRPPRPNGPVLYYILRYRLRQRHTDPWNTKCLTSQEWGRDSRGANVLSFRAMDSSEDDDSGIPTTGGLLLNSLRPGEYEFQIKAVSLADKGNWTPYKTFHIMGTNKPTNTTIIILCIIFVTISVTIPLAIFTKCYCDQRRRRKELICGNSYSIVYREDEWELKPSQLEIDTPLGQGTFGMVHRGQIINLNTPAKSFLPGGENLSEDQPLPRVEAAVKTVRRNSSFDDKKAFLLEASSMKSVRSYHVVRLLGVVSSIQNPKVAMEFMLHADLARYLCEHMHQEAPGGQRLICWAAQIADGMAYLAAKKIVHRDLAARNCLLDANLTAKIGDFGLARAMNYHDYYQKRGQAKLPFRWMAPEALCRGTSTVYSDVWSYGVVLWEMATFAAVPYHNLSQEAVIDWVRKGHTLLAPGRGAMENILESWHEEPCPPILLELMAACFTFAYLERPTFMEILNRLSPHLASEILRHSFYRSGLTPEEDVDEDVDQLAPSEEPPARPAAPDPEPTANGSSGGHSPAGTSKRDLRAIPLRILRRLRHASEGSDVSDASIPEEAISLRAAEAFA